MKTVKKLVPVAVAAAVAAFSTSVQTAGFQLPENNASGLANAFAGQAAAAENASTVFWNPAGMTQLKGKQVSFALNVLKPSIKFEDNGLSRSPLGAPLGPGGGNGGDGGDWTFLPAGYATWQINPQWWVGVGLTVPFGLEIDYDRNFIGRFQAQRIQIKTMDINPSVAYKLSDAVSLGGGISYQKFKVQFDRSTLLPGGVEGLTQTRVEDEQWGFNLGALFTIGAGTRIGITYRSSMDYNTDGTLLVGNVPVLGSTVQGAAASVKLPDTVSWGIAHPLNSQWELLGDLTWTRWSTIKTVALNTTSPSALLPTVPTNVDTFQLQFRDSYRVGVGANWKYRDDLTFKAGIAYDRSPVTDFYRTTLLPDDNRIALAFGAKFQVNKQATLDVGYMHLFVDNGGIDQRLGVVPVPAPGSPPGRFQGNVRGSYDNQLDAFAVQLSYSF